MISAENYVIKNIGLRAYLRENGDLPPPRAKL